MFLQTQLPNKNCHSNHHITGRLLHAHTEKFLQSRRRHLLPSATWGEEGRGGREAGEGELLPMSARRQVEGVAGPRHRGRESFSVELSSGFHQDLEGAQPPRASG